MKKILLFLVALAILGGVIFFVNKTVESNVETAKLYTAYSIEDDRKYPEKRIKVKISQFQPEYEKKGLLKKKTEVSRILVKGTLSNRSEFVNYRSPKIRIFAYTNSDKREGFEFFITPNVTLRADRIESFTGYIDSPNVNAHEIDDVESWNAKVVTAEVLD